MTNILASFSARRLTIGMSMLFVMAAAVCIAALRYSSPLVASLTFTATLTILLFSVIAAFFDRRKAFWIGFVVFGWGYAILSCAPGAWDGIRPYLFTTRILYALRYRINDVSPSEEFRINPGMSYERIIRIPSDAGLDTLGLTTDQSECFQRIGHSISAFLHGVVGGILAVILAARTSKVRGRGDAPT
jgi:hypothetical protein